MRHESRDLQSALVPINYGEWGGGRCYKTVGGEWHVKFDSYEKGG